MQFVTDVWYCFPIRIDDGQQQPAANRECICIYVGQSLLISSPIDWNPVVCPTGVNS